MVQRAVEDGRGDGLVLPLFSCPSRMTVRAVGSDDLAPRHHLPPYALPPRMGAEELMADWRFGGVVFSQY